MKNIERKDKAMIRFDKASKTSQGVHNETKQRKGRYKARQDNVRQCRIRQSKVNLVMTRQNAK